MSRYNSAIRSIHGIGRVVAQSVEQGDTSSPFPCPCTGPKDRGLPDFQDASSILADSSSFSQARMGVGRAPPVTVAQQRCTEHVVAAPASMVHEDGAVRTHDDAMRVRLPPVRVPSSSRRHRRASLATPLPASHRCGPTVEGYLAQRVRLPPSQMSSTASRSRAGRRISVIPFTEPPGLAARDETHQLICSRRLV